MNTLLYCLGEEAESVLAYTGLKVAPDTKYDAVMENFDEHFKVRRNVIFGRAHFKRHCQREGESIEQSITELYNLIEFCEYGEFKEQLLRDRLVVGIRDLAMSENLQTDLASYPGSLVGNEATKQTLTYLGICKDQGLDKKLQ